MTEVLFILTIVFVAYVLYTTLDSAEGFSKSKAVPVQAVMPKKNKEEVSVAPQQSKAETSVAPVVGAEKAVNSLRDPKTGEIAAIPNNYRFAKRWIKDALVAEGLLDKVYKNNELDGANADKVKNAMEQLKTMEKYHP